MKQGLNNSRFQVHTTIGCSTPTNQEKPQTNTWSSLVADLCCRHGDTDRSIDLLGLRCPGFWLTRHGNACNRANSSSCSSKHQLPPPIVGLLLGIIVQLHLLPLGGCRPGRVDHHQPPPGGCRGRAVGQARTTKEGGCHGDWSHCFWALGANCFLSLDR